MPLGDLEEEELHKVLLIGTDKLFNDRIKDFMPESEEYKYEYASSGFQAGSLAHSFNPDSIIIDLSLGRSESIQITTNLRKLEAYTNTLIIGLAGEDEAEPEKLKEYGFDDVFKKPFDTQLLAERVKSLAASKREQ
jgi:DNA-binding response OmpR family regulator